MSFCQPAGSNIKVGALFKFAHIPQMISVWYVTKSIIMNATYLVKVIVKFDKFVASFMNLL